MYAAEVGRAHAFRVSQDPSSEHGGERTPIRVRAVPQAGITAVASRSHSTPETEAYLAGYAVAERVSIGSSLKFCLVAEGRADLYPRLSTTMEWDTAAGQAVLVGAGGKVLGEDGTPLRYGKPQFRNGWFVAAGALEPRRPA
jgi:3'-phosphoadenosine 5'-phosphosulfate (PAPS) 3'-phosphatase